MRVSCQAPITIRLSQHRSFHILLQFRLPVSFAMAYDSVLAKLAISSALVTLPSSRYFLPIVIGILSHNCIFIFGEWHIRAPVVLKCHVGVFVLGVFVDLAYGSGKILDSFRTSALAMFVYASALLLSMTVYRKFFHRLRGFPGPWMAGFTKLWHVYHWANSQNHLLLDRMYQKYGQFVRTGPEVLRAVDGPGSSCTKAVWYEFLLPELAVNTTRSKPA